MADLKDTLRADLTTAMKARDSFRTGVLRMVLTAIHTEEVAGDEARELSHDEEESLIGREVRKRKESAEMYDAGNRPELAAKERAEVDLLSTYLPAPLTEAELDHIVAEEVAALGEGASMRQMGQVIKAVNARIKGRADGSVVAAKVKSALTI
ncbi:MAG TPA: GatB/YqeY domain-containing protein [Propionibacteriaceae bacterium]|nr:GatB/YqeY domain-containing protein [Propionibacteriaceae bacterium]HQE32708.1 GatB/YqeY domain-containing protein [Propionibacteriaceae bacterium]